MLYLIEPSGFEKDNNGNIRYFQLLKIGYTSDTKKGLRYINYKLHNPTFVILYEIPNATEDHEKLVHEKFRNLRYKKYGREWFYYDQSIIDFFKNSTLVDLDKLGNTIKIKPRKNITRILSTVRSKILRLNFDSTKEINYWLSELENNYGRGLTMEKAIEFLKNNNIDLTGYTYLSTGIYSKDNISNQKIKEFMKNYPKKEISKKVRYIVENNDKLTKDQFNILLKCIEKSVQNYITILGFDGCKACGYNITYMNNACKKKTFNKESLLDAIYSNFQVGSVYSLSDLKKKLGEIYQSIGYLEAPKAIDINKYFETKNRSTYLKLGNGKKKKVRGYELIKKLY